MATQNLKTKLVVEAETKGGEQIEQLKSDIDALGKEGTQAAPQFDALAKGIDKVGASAETSGNKADVAAKRVALLGTAYAALQTAMGALRAATGIVETADAYGQMAERIRMATSSQEEYDLVQQRLLESANTTYRALSEQQEMFIRSAAALKSYGYNTEQAIDITDSFSYLLATNAASAERGAAAIDAYSKAVQTGRVDADAWQSILAATPTIVDAVAKATGKAASEIRSLGAEGKLSITDLNEALRQTVDANKAATEGMVTTVKDAMTRLSNTWSAYIGEGNRANQTTAKMVQMIDMLSNNLDSVINLAVTAGSVMAAVWGARTLQALVQYIKSLKTAAVATTALTAETVKAASAAEKLGAAGKLAAAGWIGWEIGTYLREEFSGVEKAGIALAASLQKSAVRAQAAWKLLRAAVSDDTFASVIDEMNVKLRELDDEYAVLFEAAGKQEQQQKKVAAATGAAGAAATNAVVQWNGLVTAYEAVNNALAQQNTAMEARNALRSAEAEAAVKLAQALGTENELRLAQAQAAVAQAAIAKQVAEARQTELAVLVAERDALAALGEELLKTNPEKKKQLDDLNTEIGLRQQVAEQATVAAQAAKVAAAAALAEAEAVKDNSARVAELSAAYRSAREQLDAVREAYAQGKAGAEALASAEVEAAKAATLYRDALADKRKALESANNLEQASLSVQSAAVRVSIEQQNAIAEVAKARGDNQRATQAQNEAQRLEIQLAELGAEAKRAEATADQQKAELRKQELIAAGEYDGVKKQEVEAALKAAEVKQKEADIAEITAQKMRDVAAAQDEAARSAKDMENADADATKQKQQLAQAVEVSWVSATAAASKYKDEAIKYADQIEGRWQSAGGQMIVSWNQYFSAWNTHFSTLRKLADEYASALERIDQKQADLEQANSGAASGVEDLRMQLLKLNGTEEEIAKAEYERDRQKIEYQMQLAELEAERAAIRGDTAAAEKQREEIALYREQLKLLQQIYKEEEKQRKAKKDKSASSSSSSSSGGGSSGSSSSASGSGGISGGSNTSSTSMPVTINLSVNGITDPVKLARQLEPELKKLDRLAR